MMIRPSARLLLWLCIATGLAVDVISNQGPVSKVLREWSQRPKVVAIVNQTRITETSLAERLRERIWRRGEDWSRLSDSERHAARAAVLNDRIDEVLLVAASPAAPDAANLHSALDELHHFQLMLGWEAGRFERALRSQGGTESDFIQSIRQQLQRGTWLHECKMPGDENEPDADAWIASHPGVRDVPNRYHAAHIFLSGFEKDKADRAEEMAAVANDLNTGKETFAALAARHSEDERTKHRGGDLGWFTVSRMPADFMAAVQSLRPGLTSGVVRTRLGWHLIRLIETTGAAKAPDENILPEVAALLDQVRRQAAVTRSLAALREHARIHIDDMALVKLAPAPFPFAEP